MPLLTRGAPLEFFNGHGRAPPAHPSPPQGSFAPLTTTHLFWLAQRQKAICMAMCFGLTKNHCSVPQWASLRGPIGLGHKGNPLAIKFIGHTPSPQDHWTTSQKDFVLCRIAWDLFVAMVLGRAPLGSLARVAMGSPTWQSQPHMNF